MKKLLIALTATLTFNSVAADNHCTEIEGLSKAIMGARQANAPMGKMMAIAKRSGFGFAESLVIKAYKRPLFSSSEMKKREAVDFANEVYLECLTVASNEG